MEIHIAGRNALLKQAFPAGHADVDDYPNG
jgi:hypothetical protein